MFCFLYKGPITQNQNGVDLGAPQLVFNHIPKPEYPAYYNSSCSHQQNSLPPAPHQSPLPQHPPTPLHPPPQGEMMVQINDPLPGGSMQNGALSPNNHPHHTHQPPPTANNHRGHLPRKRPKHTSISSVDEDDNMQDDDQVGGNSGLAKIIYLRQFLGYYKPK